MRDHQYSAFISYSHQDERWASWLQKRLEAYRGPDPARRHPFRPVFRDRSDLSAGELGPAIESALAASAALIVICSPSAAESEWVAAEIRTYRGLHSDPLILPLVVDAESGAPYEAVFPEALLRSGANSDEAVDMLAADVREDKDGRQDAFLKIAAALLGAPFDSLKRRADRQRFRRLVTITAASAAIALGAVALSVMTLFARQEAEQRRHQAEELVTFMIGDVRDELGQIGRLDLLDAVGSEALAYFESVDAEDVTPELLLQRGRAFRQIGDVRTDQGQNDAGLELFQLAISVLERAAMESVDAALDEEIQHELAQTHLASAGVHYMRGEVDASRADMLIYRDLINGLTEIARNNPEYLFELAMADNNLGAIAMADGQTDEAEQHFRAGLDATLELIEDQPDDADLRAQAAGLRIWLGNVAERRGDDAGALVWYAAAVEDQRLAAGIDPEPANRESLSRALTIMSVAARDTDPDLALDQAREATGLMRGLVAYEPDNRIWQQRLNRALTIEVGSALVLGCLPEVPELLDEARVSADQLLALDDTVLEVQRDRIDVDVLAARYALGLGEPAEAERLSQVAYDLSEETLAVNPNDDLSMRYLLRAAKVLARSQLLQGDEVGAAATAKSAANLLQDASIEDPTADALLKALALAAENEWSGWPPEPGTGRRGCDA